MQHFRNVCCIRKGEILEYHQIRFKSGKEIADCVDAEQLVIGTYETAVYALEQGNRLSEAFPGAFHVEGGDPGGDIYGRELLQFGTSSNN